jgi:outer membrane receptor protein involved in Fe transport
VALIAKPSLPTAPLDYSSDSEIYSVEAQQIWMTDRHSFVLGGRYQTGSFDTRSRLGPSTPTLVGDGSTTLPIPVATGELEQSTSSDLERFSVYSYYSWKPIDAILLTAGLAYDQLHSPPNFRTAPLSTQEQDHDQVSPKAGIIWSPDNKTTLRANYTRSLGGVSIDQSFRLEPTQVGGFNQAFRSIIPESVVGEIANASFETAGAGIDHRFGSGTYIGLESAILFSDADRSVGTFDLATTFPFAIQPSETRQQLDYRERSLAANINQLLGNEWALGARYKISDAKLENRFPDIPVSVSSAADVTLKATLHQLDLFALFNHPAGFFAGADALWTSQSNRGYTPELPGDDFWHFNAFAGYRFAQRRVQIALGVLNLSDQDYRLNPLNLTQDLARRRTFTVSMKLAF